MNAFLSRLTVLENREMKSEMVVRAVMSHVWEIPYIHFHSFHSFLIISSHFCLLVLLHSLNEPQVSGDSIIIDSIRRNSCFRFILLTLRVKKQSCPQLNLIHWFLKFWLINKLTKSVLNSFQEMNNQIIKIRYLLSKFKYYFLFSHL